MSWRRRIDRPPEDARPGVWVVVDPMVRAPIDVTDERVTLVFSDDDAFDGSVRVYVAR
jgi:hypothetical protein